jgi:hypothetical protein
MEPPSADKKRQVLTLLVFVGMTSFAKTLDSAP